MEKQKTKLDQMLEELEKTCGKYWGDWKGDEEGTYQIECMDGMEYDVEEIIEIYDFEILEKTWFSGSEFDGYLFTIKL